MTETTRWSRPPSADVMPQMAGRTRRRGPQTQRPVTRWNAGFLAPTFPFELGKIHRRVSFHRRIPKNTKERVFFPPPGRDGSHVCSPFVVVMQTESQTRLPFFCQCDLQPHLPERPGLVWGCSDRLPAFTPSPLAVSGRCSSGGKRRCQSESGGLSLS